MLRRSVETAPGFVDTPSFGGKEVHDAKEPSAVPARSSGSGSSSSFAKGATPEELARQFEPSAQAIRNWVKQADRDAGERTDGLTTEEREELRRLRRENRQLREEREIL